MDLAINVMSSVLVNTLSSTSGRSPWAYAVDPLHEALCKGQGVTLRGCGVREVRHESVPNSAHQNSKSQPLSLCEEGGPGVASCLQGICPSRRTSRLLQRGFNTLFVRQM